ncbi:MAG: transporter [Deltaproteobacteria bacterium]|nr:MAG: transporter [Deltaproteobacteria bacterium]
MPKDINHVRILSAPDKKQCLDAVQLSQLEESFRKWAEGSQRRDVCLSRRRILLIFLLIRYTGGKLNEVLALDPFNDIDHDRQLVLFYNTDPDSETKSRQVQISESLSREIQSTLADPAFKDSFPNLFDIDPGFVRRKFYERAEACGFLKHLGGPEMIRKARAVELMHSNMPLPAVQMMLGHSTPNLTTSFVSFSKDEIRRIIKLFMERESSRKTSARNSFFGKIQEILSGTIQARVELATIGGYKVTTMITNESLEQLGLEKGKLITAEVKAPCVILQKTVEEPVCSAENRFNGIVVRINKGKVSSEYVIRISDGTDLCSIVSTKSAKYLRLKEGDTVWATFNCFSVVLHAE